MTNKEALKKALNKIGWEVRGVYPRERIIDHNKQVKGIKVYNDRLEISEDKYTCCFYFSNTELYELETNSTIDCIGLKASKNVFIQFYNHDKLPITPKGNEIKNNERIYIKLLWS